MDNKIKDTVAAPAPADVEAAKKSKRKKHIIIVAVAVAVVLAAVAAVTLTLTLSKGEDEAYDPFADGEYIDVVAVNRYGGVVEPQETVKIEKDADLKISEIYVKAGDTVKKGDKLFSYDSAQTKLDLELAKLEYDGLSNEITGYDNQITELTNQRRQANDDQKLDYTLQIQQAELSKSRAQMNLRSKQLDIDRLEDKIDASEVVSPINGIIKSAPSDVSDNSETDNTAFITILTTEGYRVRGSVDEANIYNLYEDMQVKVYPRTDDSKSWSGKITKIDTESKDGDNNNNSDMYGMSDDSSAEKATKYSFYVTLEDAGDVLLGQHVYIEPVEEFDENYDNAGDDIDEDMEVLPDKAE